MSRFSTNFTCNETEKKQWLDGGKDHFKTPMMRLPFLCTDKFDECIGWVCPAFMLCFMGADTMARIDGHAPILPDHGFPFAKPSEVWDNTKEYIPECIGFCCCGPCMICLARAKGRIKYDLHGNGFVGDCLFTWCCPCCSLQQIRDELVSHTGSSAGGPPTQAM